MYNKSTVTIEEVEQALQDANGQPTVAAKALGITYPTLWRFMQKHPQLKDVQKASRSRIFQEMGQLTEYAIKTGFMRKSVLDQFGNIIPGEYILMPIDERTRLDAAFKMMAMFKGDEDIVEKVEVEVKGSVPISSWLNQNTLKLDDKGTTDI